MQFNFLVLLIFFGTICMVNLFIAVIISDSKEMRENASTEALISMAHYSYIGLNRKIKLYLKKDYQKLLFSGVHSAESFVEENGSWGCEW